MLRGEGAGRGDGFLILKYRRTLYYYARFDSAELFFILLIIYGVQIAKRLYTKLMRRNSLRRFAVYTQNNNIKKKHMETEQNTHIGKIMKITTDVDVLF